MSLTFKHLFGFYAHESYFLTLHCICSKLSGIKKVKYLQNNLPLVERQFLFAAAFGSPPGLGPLARTKTRNNALFLMLS